MAVWEIPLVSPPEMSKIWTAIISQRIPYLTYMYDSDTSTLKHLKVGHGEQTVEARRYVGPVNGHSTGARLRLSGTLHSRQRKRATESCCLMDSQNSPSSTLGVRLWSTLSAKKKTVTVGSLFPLRKDWTLSLTPSWGAAGNSRRCKFTYNKRAK